MEDGIWGRLVGLGSGPRRYVDLSELPLGPSFPGSLTQPTGVFQSTQGRVGVGGLTPHRYWGARSQCGD